MKRTMIFGIFLKAFYVLTLFISSTFAFFSDSVLNENNLIVLGNLRANVIYSPSYDDELKTLIGDLTDLKTSTTPFFVFDGDVQPGDFIEGFIRVANTGTITFDYFFFFEIIQNTNNFSSILSLEVEDLTTPNAMQLLNGDSIETLTEGNALSIDDFQIFRLKLTVLSTASDLFNDPSKLFEFSMNFSLYAWQANFPESRPTI
jgi:hypothetical protein